MKIANYLNKKKEEKMKRDLPLIARVNLVELKKQREANARLGETSILAKADYTKRIPTIRLCYVAMEKFKRYGTEETKVGQTYGFSSPFRLPYEMTIEDACRVVSFLSEKVENENNIEPASEQSVAMVSKGLASFGFDRVESRPHGHIHTVSEYDPMRRIQSEALGCGEIDGVVDLFTIGGDFKVFKRSDLYDRYFDWFTEGVSQQEVFDIYKNIRREYLLEGGLKCASSSNCCAEECES